MVLKQAEMFKENGDNEAYKKSQMKVKEWQKRNSEFSKNNNVKRDFTREYVSINNKLFEDNPILDDFKNLDNQVEHLIIYDINTDKKLLQISSKSKSSVGSTKALMKFITSKPNSLVAVHNHLSNSSFSLTDILTFNKYKSINLIVVKTDKYLYYLEKNSISKLKKEKIKKCMMKTLKSIKRNIAKERQYIIQIFILVRKLDGIMEKLVIKNKIKDKIKDLSNEEIEEFVDAMYENNTAPKNDKELNELIDSLINSEYLFDDRELEGLGEDSDQSEVDNENNEETNIPDFLKDRNSTQK